MLNDLGILHRIRFQDAALRTAPSPQELPSGKDQLWLSAHRLQGIPGT